MVNINKAWERAIISTYFRIFFPKSFLDVLNCTCGLGGSLSHQLELLQHPGRGSDSQLFEQPPLCIFVNFKTFLISGHSDQTIDFPDLPFIEGIDFCCHMGNPVQIFVSLIVFQPLAQLGRHLEIIISALNIFHCRPVFPDHIREKFAFIDFPDLQPQL